MVQSLSISRDNFHNSSEINENCKVFSCLTFVVYGMCYVVTYVPDYV